MAKAFIVLRALDHSEKDRIKKCLDNEEGARLYCDTAPDQFPGRSTPLPVLDAEEKKRINYDVFDTIIHFGDRKTQNTTLGAMLTFNTAGLWYYHKFRIYFLLRNLAYELAVLDKLAETHETAELYTDNKTLQLPGVVPSNISVLTPASARRGKRHIRAKLAFLSTAVVRLLIGVFTQRYHLKKAKHIFADSRWQYRSMLDKTGQGIVYENAYLGYMFQETDESFAFIDQLIIPKFDEPPTFSMEVNHFRNHGNRKRVNEELVFLRGLLSIGTIRSIRTSFKQLRSAYQALRSLPDTGRFDRLIIDNILRLHFSSVYYLIKYHVYLRFFGTNRVWTATATDENSPNFKIILDAARARGITTVGYQHGSMHPLHPAYMYSEKDMENPPVPDHTLLWGDKWRNMLVTRGHYSPDRLHVTGQLRTDIIVSIRNNHKITTERLLPHCSNKFIVLFASQPQRDPHLRRRAAEDVFTAVRDLPEIHLLLKLHPREKDPGYYSAIAQHTGCRNYSFTGDLDLYVLLHLANAVVTCFSTVGTEAIYFEKPLVILDHLKQDILDYHKDGVAFQTFDADHLKTVLRELQEGTRTYDRTAYAKYIQSTAYKIDGKAAKRFLAFLDMQMPGTGINDP